MIATKRRLFWRTLWLLFLLTLGAILYVYLQLRGSLPQLDGEHHLTGLIEPVHISRDKRGTATLKASNRQDVARALGFVHGQERFFQMDLLRRNAAGELSALFGDAALERDREIRLHQFRQRAEQYIPTLPDAHQAILMAYTQGVNQGLDALSSAPFEYWLLDATPVPWRQTDTFLALYSMFLDLQYHDGRRDRSLTLMRDHLPNDLYAFLQPKGSRWDSTIDDSNRSASPPPASSWPVMDEPVAYLDDPLSDDRRVGSNNWAVSGALTPYHAAMVADDMHLGIGVPNTWYRARFEWQENGESHSLDGVTLPGTPIMVVGSNSHVAWGFTNSYGDWSDVIRLQLDDNGERYLTPDGYQAFDYQDETIKIKGNDSNTLTVRRTIWGPVIGEDADGNPLAYRWVAHDREGANLNLMGMETVKDVYEGISVANHSGIPAQNIMLADRDGNIAWTIAGRMPIRQGIDGRYVSDWSSANKGWFGYRLSSDYPALINPLEHRLWTGNSRVVGGEQYAKIGDGGYALGARAQQIEQRLFSKDSFTEQDLLAIQMDAEAVFLKRWQELLLNQPWLDEFSEARSIIESWSGHASTEDLGYLLVRQFRLKVRNAITAPLQQYLEDQDPHFNLRSVRAMMEPAVWQLASEQPEHLVLPDATDWSTTLRDAFQATIDELNDDYGDWRELTWGEFNAAHIRHPLSAFIPGLGWLADMPTDALAGDSQMPNVSGGGFGASQRLVVAPGHEENGILHMPSSQSGHPLSPYFGVGHNDWVEGRPTPLLPQAEQYHLTLQPTVDKSRAAQ